MFVSASVVNVIFPVFCVCGIGSVIVVGYMINVFVVSTSCNISFAHFHFIDAGVDCIVLDEYMAVCAMASYFIFIEIMGGTIGNDLITIMAIHASFFASLIMCTIPAFTCPNGPILCLGFIWKAKMRRLSVINVSIRVLTFACLR